VVVDHPAPADLATMRQVMLGKTLTVPCPYRGAPLEAETLTTWLQHELAALFGRSFPHGEGRLGMSGPACASYQNDPRPTPMAASSPRYAERCNPF